MTTDSMRAEDDAKLFLGEAWSDPIEAAGGDRIRGFIERLIEEELAVALGRGRTNADIGAAMAKWVRPTACRPVRRPMARRSTVTGTVIASAGSAARSGRSDRRAAGADRWCGRDGMRVEEQGAAPLRPPDEAGGSDEPGVAGNRCASHRAPYQCRQARGNLHDRSIVVRLSKALPGEVKAHLSDGTSSVLRTIKAKFVRWTAVFAIFLNLSCPQELHNRLGDNWRPLVALADLAGGRWPELIRTAALSSLSADQEEAS